MSFERPSRAVRVGLAARVETFSWGRTPDRPPATAATMVPGRHEPGPAAAIGVPIDVPVDRTALADLEREAFTKGYAQGERAGAEAAATRAEAMLRRLAQTLGELGTLRAEMMHKTERQLVQLSLAIASRVIRREVSLDRELLVAMARVALDRLGDSASATIRLHPDDFKAAHADQQSADQAVRIVADPTVRPGGCLVQSDFGLIDIGVDAQLTELSAALLGDDAAPALEEAKVRVEHGLVA